MSRLLSRFYRSLYRIRHVEERIASVYPTDVIKSPVHLSIGQEAVSVGVCEALRADDVVFGSYRSHALYLAKGGDLARMIAELYGKATGCAKGKGGSMHLVDVAAGVMGTSAVVGSTIPNAVGYAYALQCLDSDRVVASFFGDGGAEEGVFHESLNFAALKGVPVLFVCENNRYAIHTHQRLRQPLDNIHEKAAVHGIPSERIESGDVFEIHERVSRAVREIREGPGRGPRFFEILTYRWREHVGPGEDYALGFRSRAELLPWQERDPVETLGRSLAPEVRARIDREVEEEVARAFAFAAESPFPRAEELWTDVLGSPPA